VKAWHTVPLGRVVTFKRGYDLPHRVRRNGDIPVVSSAGVVDYHNCAMVDPPGVVTGRYGTIGQIFLVAEPFWPLNTTLYVRDFHGNDPHFIYYLLQRFDFASFSGKSGVPGVNRNDLHAETVELPFDVLEQRAIAAALSDVDALLEGLTRLIAKKSDLKQAAMQQLLTGHTRLHGFRGEWEAAAFGDIVAIRNSRVVASSTPARTQCVELESIGQGTGRLLGSIDASGSSSKYSFKKGDVLFGRLRAYLRKYWLATFDGICSTEIWPLIPRDNRLVGSFLHLLVQTNELVNAACVSYGTHMPRSDWSVMRQLRVQVPCPHEQAAIAGVLSDMDLELSALEARRDKTRALKQAMMQELLTGRTRLI
jgi:type I restriction enzyme, S subunit